MDQYTTKLSTLNGFYHVKSGSAGRMKVELTLEGTSCRPLKKTSQKCGLYFQESQT